MNLSGSGQCWDHVGRDSGDDGPIGAGLQVQVYQAQHGWLFMSKYVFTNLFDLILNPL